MTTFKTIVMTALLASAPIGAATAQPAAPAYFTSVPALHMTRDAQGVLTVEFNTRGGAYTRAFISFNR